MLEVLEFVLLNVLGNLFLRSAQNVLKKQTVALDTQSSSLYFLNEKMIDDGHFFSPGFQPA